jgi:hypothetical protein
MGPRCGSWREPSEKADVDAVIIKGAAGQERASGGFLVSSGSSACYRLHAGRPIVKSISAIRALAKRHVPLAVAKADLERVTVGQEIVVDLPMLEDAALFEAELLELGVRAVRQDSNAAAAEA